MTNEFVYGEHRFRVSNLVGKDMGMCSLSDKVAYINLME